EHLARSGEEEELRRRHLEHFLALGEAAEPELFAADQIAWFARLEDEHDNMRAALEFALDSGDPLSGLRLAVAIRRFWSIHGQLDAARELYAEGIDHFASLEDIRGQALAKENLGLLELTAGDVPKAVRWLTEARDLAREAGVNHEIAAASRSLAAALIELGETERARKLRDESLALSREIGEPHGVAVCLDTYAGLAATVGETERAATLFGASDAV